MDQAKRLTMLPGLLLVVTLLLGAGPDEPQTQTEDSNMQVGDDQAQTNPFYGFDDGYVCACVEHYRDGREVVVVSCDDTAERCPPADLLFDCRDEPDGPGCDDYLVDCECDCTALESTTEFAHGPFEDVVLTGVPDLWQFNFMCGSAESNANAVGCGPVAAGMLLYHWAQQGYQGLIDDFMIGSAGASGPNEEAHDWQALVRELRADYLDGGICVPVRGGEYATLMHKMTSGIREYIEDAGYSDVDVDHYKVCKDCTASADDELQGDVALALIKDELHAGRPVIMGFNTGPTLSSYVYLLEDKASELVYTGELSNGMPIGGIIDHYALITGYRRIDGREVLVLNAGAGEGWHDLNVEWNPAGKWLHLYTVDIESAPDGEDWCSIDRGYTPDDNPPQAAAFTQPYITLSNADRATSTEINQLTALGGASCGIALEGETSVYFDTKLEIETCLGIDDLPEEQDLPAWNTETTTITPGHGRPIGDSSAPPIHDQELP